MAEHLLTWGPDDLLNAPVDDVVEQLVDKGSVRCPRLLTDQAWMPEPTEVNQQVTQFGDRFARRVTRLVLVVPFEGERVVFRMRANRSSLNPPRVLRLENNDLHLAVDGPSEDSAQVKARFDQQIEAIERHLAWSRAQIEHHNQQTQDQVPELVTQRREQLLTVRHLQHAGHVAQRLHHGVEIALAEELVLTACANSV